MCGIVGSINIAFGNTVLDTIKHRGPDSFGMDCFNVNNHEVQFGHRRLAILDLTPAGHQPMNSFCEDYSIIFNGEVYNHLELKNKLPCTKQFQGHSDTETLLYYIKEFGIESIKDFNGIYAIAYLDKQKNKLYLARDPFGVKPLYYYHENNTLFFASEIRPIRKLVVKHTLNKEALGTLLRLRYNPAPDTMHREIKKVYPGHYLEIDLSGNDLNIINKPFLEKISKTVSRPYNLAVREYGQQLEQAVKRQLLSDVEIGVFLSGGIDSAIIAALAQKHYHGDVKAFTIGFEGNFIQDEIEDAAETAHYLGLEHHYKKISFTDFINIMKECIRIVEEPLATTSLIPMYFLSELASKHLKVVLTGQGADEPLGGYNRYKTELLRSRVPKFLLGMVLPMVKFLKIKNEKILRGASALTIRNEIQRFLSIYEIFSVPEIEMLINVNDTSSYKSINYFYELLECKTKTTSAERMMAMDTHLNLSDDLLNYTDKVTMNFGLECRVPMLDLELVKFIESLPIKYKVNVKEGKLIHKDYAKQILPHNIINRKKRGFQSPTIYWFKEESEIIEEILLNEHTYFAKIFNQVYIADIIRQHKKGYNKEKQIFLLLSIYFTLESLD